MADTAVLLGFPSAPTLPVVSVLQHAPDYRSAKRTFSSESILSTSRISEVFLQYSSTSILLPQYEQKQNERHSSILRSAPHFSHLISIIFIIVTCLKKILPLPDNFFWLPEYNLPYLYAPFSTPINPNNYAGLQKPVLKTPLNTVMYNSRFWSFLLWKCFFQKLWKIFFKLVDIHPGKW